MMLLFLCAGLFALPRAARAVPIQVTYRDAAGVGFNDARLGELRRTAFEASMAVWSQKITGTMPIRVSASMDALGGGSGFIILGAASPTSYYSDFSDKAVANTWYTGSLAKQIAGQDFDPGQPDIYCVFNTELDDLDIGAKWYYGLDAKPPNNTYIDFFTVVLHEIGHGLGFSDTIDSDGTYSLDGVRPSIYDRLLTRGSGPNGVKLTSLSDSDRAFALVSNNVYSSGPLTLAVTQDQGARIFAPNPFQPGSSTSHLDETTYSPPPDGSAATSINELMTPNSTTDTHDPGPLVTAIFRDMGFKFAGLSISGRVSNIDGSPISGVLVTAVGQNLSATTATDGTYTIEGLAEGTVTIVPTKVGLIFDPTSRTIKIGPSATGVDFRGSPPVAVTLTAPNSNASISGTFNLKAITSNNALVQRVEFSRSAPPVKSERLTNLPIPDRGTMTDSFSVNQAGKVESATASISIRHTYIGDLRVALLHLDAEGKLLSTTILYDHTGGGAQTLDTTYNNVPVLGQDMAGTWRLQVTDDVAEDTGTLVNWTLNLTGWVSLGNGTLSGSEWGTQWNTVSTPKGIYDVRARAFSGNASFSDINNNITVTPPVFAITGQVLDSNGIGKVGVVVERYNDAGVLVDKSTTRTAGLFTFANVAVGTYKLVPIPLNALMAFDKTAQEVAITTASSSLVVFKILPRFSAEVSITTDSGIPIPGIGFGAMTATYASDKYTFSNLLPGKYTITPSKPGFTFTPVSKDFTIVDANVKNITLRATASLTLGGTVRMVTGGAPVQGVAVQMQQLEPVEKDHGTVISDANGGYTFSKLQPGKYRLTAAKIDLKISRTVAVGASGDVTLDTSSRSDVNFTATPAYRLGGVIRSSTGTLAAVTVKITGGPATAPVNISTRTTGNGTYEVIGLSPGIYKVTPTLADFTFRTQDGSDTAATVTISSATVSNVNFVGTLLPQPPGGGGGGGGGGTTPLPSGVSTMTAAPVSELVRIRFTTALSASEATDISRYSVLVDGKAASISGASYHTAYFMVTLTLRTGTIKYNSTVAVTYSGIKSANGSTTFAGTATVQAR